MLKITSPAKADFGNMLIVLFSKSYKYTLFGDMS